MRLKIAPFLILIIFLIGYTSCAQNKNHELTILSANEFEKEIDSKDILLVDVRTPQEFHSGKIKDAVNWNIYESDFLDKFKDIDKEKPIYLYCRSGGRSEQAGQKLIDAGFKNVHHLDGGIMAWEARKE